MMIDCSAAPVDPNGYPAAGQPNSGLTSIDSPMSADLLSHVCGKAMEPTPTHPIVSGASFVTVNAYRAPAGIAVGFGRFMKTFHDGLGTSLAARNPTYRGNQREIS